MYFIMKLDFSTDYGQFQKYLQYVEMHAKISFYENSQL